MTPDPRRYFIETIFLMKRLTDVDISGIQNGYGMLASFSALFSYTGISNRISKKILDFTNSKIDQHDERAYANYLIAKLTYDLCMGNFVPPDPRFDSLTDRIIKGGELYSGVIMTMWSGFYFIAVGQFAKAIEMIEKLNAIHREYNQDMAGA